MFAKKTVTRITKVNYFDFRFHFYGARFRINILLALSLSIRYLLQLHKLHFQEKDKMITAGNFHKLRILRIDHSGAWLEAEDQEILLPRKECPAEIAPGVEVEVFIYVDRNQQILATRKKPVAKVGEFALLQVTSIGPHGAFLDWGIGKDLLAPFNEQTQKMLEGRRYLVRILHDKQQRPIASSKIDRFLLAENHDLTQGDEVEVIIWAFTDLGAKVIINNTYEGLIYQTDLPPHLKKGDLITAYVGRVRDDGKLDVVLHRTGAAGRDDAREVLLDALTTSGFLPLHDQSPPELIRSRLGLSKKAFKKATGMLYKEGFIELTHQGIKLLKK